MASVASAPENRLIPVESLFARATSPGEREAAGSGAERIRSRLAQVQQTERPIEYKFTLPDGWSMSLMIALLERYGLKPYRYRFAPPNYCHGQGSRVLRR